jgi:hypothetical protein
VAVVTAEERLNHVRTSPKIKNLWSLVSYTNVGPRSVFEKGQTLADPPTSVVQAGRFASLECVHAEVPERTCVAGYRLREEALVGRPDVDSFARITRGICEAYSQVLAGLGLAARASVMR